MDWDHTCAVTAGEVWCWGSNEDRQLGRIGGDSVTPLKIGGLTAVKMIHAGQRHNCARLVDDTTMCWGQGLEGQLGNGANPNDTATPVFVSGNHVFDDLALGYLHTCGYDGPSVFCWGANLGETTYNTVKNTPQPVTIPP